MQGQGSSFEKESGCPRVHCDQGDQLSRENKAVLTWPLAHSQYTKVRAINTQPSVESGYRVRKSVVCSKMHGFIAQLWHA